MDPIQQFKDMLDKSIETAKQARFEEDRRRLMSTIGQDLAKMLTPVLSSIASTSKNNKADLKDVMAELLEEVANMQRVGQGIDTAPIITAIEAAFGKVNIPQPKVIVNVPDVIVPPIKMPDEMNIKGWVSLMGVNLDNPLPVQLRDAKGRAVNLFENLTTLIGGGGGGFKTVDIGNVLNPVPITAGGTLIVDQLSGANWTVNFVSSATTIVDQVSGANWSVNVTNQGLTDTQLRASSVPVEQVSGSNWSVFATNPVAQGDSATALRVIQAGDSISSVRVDNATLAVIKSGTWSIDNPFGPGEQATALRVLVAGDSGASVSVLNASIPVTKSGTWAVDNPSGQGDTATALRVVQAGDSAVSVSATQIGTWTVALSGSLSSSVAVGPVVGGVADDGNAPVQSGGIARTTNPTKMTDGQVVKSSYDAVGRQLIRPLQVRGLTKTAYVSLTTGTETTLLAGVAGAYLDLVYVLAANNSDAATSVDIRAVTAGNIQTTIRVPANGTAGVSLPVPIPQDETGNNWSADLPDITGSTITISALFSQEV